HDLAPARKSRDAEAVPERLAERREIRRDRVERLRARQVPPESRYHLVDDEQRALAAAQRLKAGEESGRGSRRRFGFHDDARDLVRMPREETLDAVEVVVAELHRHGADAVR